MAVARSGMHSWSPADLAGWAGVAALTTVVMFTWAPRLVAPLPGNHLGNVAARYGLHVRNLYADGFIGSHAGADWAPYRSTPYAHHPPLLTALDAIVGLLPGEATFQVLLVPFLLASTALPAAAWLLRTLGFGWRPTLLAVAATAATGYFWIYSWVMVDLGPILATTAAFAGLRRDETRHRRGALAAALVFATTLTSWPGIAVAAALVVWLVVERRDRATVRVAIAAVVGIALSLAFMVGAGGGAALLDQTDERTSGGSYPIGTVVLRVWGDLTDLLPWWYLVLLPGAIGVALLDRRTRTLVAASCAFTIGWVLVLSNGAYVHDYWAYPVVVPGLLGGASLIDRVARLVDTWVRAAIGRWRAGTVASAAAGFGVLASFAIMAYGSMATEYVDRPTDAGRLIEEVDLPETQRFVWLVGFQYGRLPAYRLERPVADLTDVELPALADDELIFVDLARLPSWYPVVTAPTPIAERNGYAFVQADALRKAVSNDPASY